MKNLKKTGVNQSPAPKHQGQRSVYEGFYDIGSQDLSTLGEAMPQKRANLLDQVLVIASDRMGDGDAGYGEALLQALLMAWCERDPFPAKMLFLNTGVKLLHPKSLMADCLQRLKAQGVELYASATCLKQYKQEVDASYIEEKSLFQMAQMMKSAKNTIRL